MPNKPDKFNIKFWLTFDVAKIANKDIYFNWKKNLNIKKKYKKNI